MNIYSNLNLSSIKKYPVNTVDYKHNQQQNYKNDRLISNTAKPSSLHYAANYMPVSFTGNAPEIKNAFIITSSEDVPLVKTNNNSYVIEFDTQTEAIYGKDAVKYLKNISHFDYDTQIIFPSKAAGTIDINGKETNITENSSIIISAGADAKIKVKKGYPLILSTKRDFDWYSRHNKDSDNSSIRNKFLEMMRYNSHLYNGEITPTLFIDEELQKDSVLKKLNVDKYKEGNNLLYAIYEKRNALNDEQKEKITLNKKLIDKLYEKNVIKDTRNGYIKFTDTYNPKFETNILEEKGFTSEEIAKILPLYSQARQSRMEGIYSKHNSKNGMNEKIIKKLMDADILYRPADISGNTIYWKEAYENDAHLKEVLKQKGFSTEEQNQIVSAWTTGNKIGFDHSGLKLLSDKIAVYNLDSKINNWTMEKSCWISNSTAIASKDGKAPILGTSIVQSDITTPVPMERLRKEEHLHTHPADDDKRQTEAYLITSGYAALNIVKNGKPEVKILKEGDLAIIAPNVAHCVNSVMGEYEQVVTQIPSAFQYGFGFKRNYDMPEDYSEKDLIVEAFTSLLNAKKENEKFPFISKLLEK